MPPVTLRWPVAPEHLDSTSGPRAPGLRPLTESRRGYAKIPPTGFVIGREDRRALIALKRFPPASFILAEEAEVVDQRGPVGKCSSGSTVSGLRAGDVAVVAQLHSLAIELFGEIVG
jgi:hypothetical protein